MIDYTNLQTCPRCGEEVTHERGGHFCASDACNDRTNKLIEELFPEDEFGELHIAPGLAHKAGRISVVWASTYLGMVDTIEQGEMMREEYMQKRPKDVKKFRQAFYKRNNIKSNNRGGK